jgi:uncharacterized protein YuzB (UPF0349 family)
MRPIIEFCTSNLHHDTERLMKRLEANPDYDVVEYGCLGNCGTCYLFPFALVNGEIVEAADAADLEAKVLAKIREIEEMFEVLGGED